MCFVAYFDGDEAWSEGQNNEPWTPCDSGYLQQ